VCHFHRLNRSLSIDVGVVCGSFLHHDRSPLWVLFIGFIGLYCGPLSQGL